VSDNSGRKKGLGRGLDALLNASVEPVEVGRVGAQGDFVQIDIDQITPGTYQPRRHIKEAGLDELAASIKAQGVMQPIVVRKNKEGLYELIAGERRWRATGLAGLHSIPAVVREISDEQAAAMALIENLQREDLNPYEEAMALGRLRDQFGLTQQQIADAIGKSRTTVTNILRLLNLSSSVADLLEHGDIEMGHARALLALEPELQGITASKVKAKGLSVRKTEVLVKQILDGRSNGPDLTENHEPFNADTRRLEQELSEKLGATVTVRFKSKGKNAGGGDLVIRYGNMEKLKGILTHLRR